MTFASRISMAMGSRTSSRASTHPQALLRGPTSMLGNTAGVFTQDATFGMQYVTADGAGFRGRTENIVVADFNNDGTVDIFLPTYTYLDSHYDLGGDPSFERPGPPPNVYNALQSFLLLNDGTGKFVERAVAAGVSMHSTLSGITPGIDRPEWQSTGRHAGRRFQHGRSHRFLCRRTFVHQSRGR